MDHSERLVELDSQDMHAELNYTSSEMEFGFDDMRHELNLIYNFTDAIFGNGSMYTDTLNHLQTLVTGNDDSGLGCNLFNSLYNSHFTVWSTCPGP